MIRGMGLVKKAAALTNAELKQIPQELANYIVDAAEEVLQGNGMDNFHWSFGKQVRVRKVT